MNEVHGDKYPGMIEFHSPMGELRLTYDEFSTLFEKRMKSFHFFTENTQPKLDKVLKVISKW